MPLRNERKRPGEYLSESYRQHERAVPRTAAGQRGMDDRRYRRDGQDRKDMRRAEAAGQFMDEEADDRPAEQQRAPDITDGAMKEVSLPPRQLDDRERQRGKGDADMNGGFRRADPRRPLRIAEQSISQCHGGHRKHD